MAFVPVPKDLAQVKTKVVFNLTKRQLICFGGGVLVGLPLFLLLRERLPGSGAVLSMIAVMLPFFLLGMYEKNGQPLEKVLHHYIQSRFSVPNAVHTRPTISTPPSRGRFNTNRRYPALFRKSAAKDKKKPKLKLSRVEKAACRADETGKRTSACRTAPSRPSRISACTLTASAAWMIPTTPRPCALRHQLPTGSDGRSGSHLRRLVRYSQLICARYPCAVLLRQSSVRRSVC